MTQHSSEQLKVISENLVFGSGESYFGWNKGDSTLISYISPLFNKDLNMISQTGFNKVHIVNTTLAAKSIFNNVQVLPIGKSQCIENSERWLENNSTNTRVISISQMQYYEDDTFACESNLLNQISSNKGKDLLWVIAAGNDGRKDPSGYDCLHSKVVDNILTVSALSPSSPDIAAYSNYGLNFSDIAADGSINGNSGTSYSAPKVASIAAEIFLNFPDLSPKEVKYALLIGATSSSSLESKVRSGSYINFSKLPNKSNK